MSPQNPKQKEQQLGNYHLSEFEIAILIAFGFYYATYYVIVIAMTLFYGFTTKEKKSFIVIGYIKMKIFLNRLLAKVFFVKKKKEF